MNSTCRPNPGEHTLRDKRRLSAERGLFKAGRPFLEGLSFLWRAGMWADRRLTKRRKLPKPVISVGNISLGGTGKTPFVAYLARYLAGLGMRVAVLTRGYKASGREKDEPGELSASVPGLRVILAPDRYKAASKALAEKDPPSVFLLDDGFQHWRLDRDLDIVLLDAIRPFGLGKVFPAGLLREGPRALARAQVVVVTRCGLVGPEKLHLLLGYLRVRFPHLTLGVCTERVSGYRDLTGNEVDRPEGKVFCACGLGNPACFFRCVEKEGFERTGQKAFRDHHVWSPSDIVHVEREAKRCGAGAVVTTGKDATKIAAEWTDLQWVVMEIRTEFASGENSVLDMVKRTVGKL